MDPAETVVMLGALLFLAGICNLQGEVTMQICGILKLVKREASKQKASLRVPSVCSELPTAEKPWRLFFVKQSVVSTWSKTL